MHGIAAAVALTLYTGSTFAQNADELLNDAATPHNVVTYGKGFLRLRL